MAKRKGRHEAEIRIACVQMEPRIGRTSANVERSIEYLAEVASNGAHLVVLPELVNSGYVFESREEAFALAEEVPNGPTVKALEQCRSRARSTSGRRHDRT